MDAWLEGLPVVTTPVGAEGLVREAEDECMPSTPGNSITSMPGESSPSTTDSGDKDPPVGPLGPPCWGGLCSSTDADTFAADAVRLHEDAALWAASCEEGQRLISDLFDASIRCVACKDLYPQTAALSGDRSVHCINKLHCKMCG